MGAKRASGTEETCMYKKLADQLREKKGVQWAQAKLEIADGESHHVEFIRGKDLARHLRAAPEKLEGLVQPVRPGRTLEDQIRDLVQFFIQKGLLRKADRKYKRPKPGKKRLVKFPKTLLSCPDQSWDENLFYVWQYDRPTPLLHYVGAVALPIVVIAACLFPLAPWWMRMALAYTLLAVLMTLLLVILVRYLVFGTVWTLLGYSLWIFPNMMSEEVGVLDAFRPVFSFHGPPKGKSIWKQRLVAAVVLATVGYLLYSHSPDVDQLKDEALKAHESLLDYLDMAGKHKSFLAGSNDSTASSQQRPPTGSAKS